MPLLPYLELWTNLCSTVSLVCLIDDVRNETTWSRKSDVRRRSPGYEPDELLLLHSAIKTIMCKLRRFLELRRFSPLALGYHKLFP
nr:MAG TPA: hypothetical protein [Caudoviricetes sp.]